MRNKIDFCPLIVEIVSMVIITINCIINSIVNYVGFYLWFSIIFFVLASITIISVLIHCNFEILRLRKKLSYWKEIDE